MKQANPYPLRVEAETLNKIKDIAKQEGRSLNKQIEYILKQYLNSQKPKEWF